MLFSVLSFCRCALAGLGWMLLLGPAARADSASEAKALPRLRMVASSVQNHRDGTVRFLRLSKPGITDERLEVLSEFPATEYLAIVTPGATAAGFAPIASLKQLDTLLLAGSGITDAGLQVLRELPKLERLYLDDSPITDEGLETLSQISSLRVLSLKRTAVTNAGLRRLPALSQLEVLLLDEVKIDDSSLAVIGQWEKLKTLQLNGTLVRGSDLSALAKLKSLESLDLSDCPLRDLDVKTLASLPQLKTLNLHHTQLAAESLDALAATLRKRKGGLFGLPWNPPQAATTSPTTKSGSQSGQAPLALGEILAPVTLRFASERPADGAAQTPDFQRHVLPLLGRLGCNGRACHGSFQGQGGFRLSMFGYDFAADHQALTAGEAPRAQLKKPAESLILRKPTSADEHGGGERFRPGGWEYHLLHAWIAGGAPPLAAEAAQFDRLEITPAEIVFNNDGEKQPLRVIAVWSDGSREDVTPLTRFLSNDDAVATVTADGVVASSGAGDTHIVCFYDNGVHPVPVLRPFAQQADQPYPALRAATPIDEFINGKLAKLRIVPAELCTDDEFLRRVSLDLIGTLPTPEEIRAFLADTASDKRTRKVEELLERPAYVAWWTVRLCDLTGENSGYLGSTEMASVVSEQWRTWMERRVRDNDGWDKIAAGIILGTSRKPGQTYDEYVQEQSAFTRRNEPADFTAPGNSMPHYWYRSNQSLPKDKALAFGYAFLGVRLQCAECHKHPFDQWSQQDFEQFTAFFTRIQTGTAPDALAAQNETKAMLGVPTKLNTASQRRQSYLAVAAEGRVIPWNEVYIDAPGDKPQPARLLGGEALDLSQHQDPRVPLMNWLREQDNPYFATAFVNRMWANYFNVGIVDPPDDLNLANPPSNRELLDYLTRNFIAHDYDMQWLHREITTSDAYQRSWRTNASNRADPRNFSHAVVRRLPAEVVVDAITQSTANTAALKEVNTKVLGRTINHHPRSYQARTLEYSLLVFGKPLRTTNCDCERQTSPTLLQSLYLRNDEEIFQKMRRADGWASELRKAPEPPAWEKIVEEAYLRTLSRLPTAAERADCAQYLADVAQPDEALQDLLWVLLNTHEFVTNH